MKSAIILSLLFSIPSFAHFMPESVKSEYLLNAIDQNKDLVRYEILEGSGPKVKATTNFIKLLAGIPFRDESGEWNDNDWEEISIEMVNGQKSYLLHCGSVRSKEQSDRGNEGSQTPIRYHYSIEFFTCKLINSETQKVKYIPIGEYTWTQEDKY